MIDTWKDAFTIVGGFAATALTVVTIYRGQSSKREMQIPEPILIQLTNLCNDMTHMAEDFKAAQKKWESTHRQVNDIRMALITWGKMRKTDGSATETDEI